MGVVYRARDLTLNRVVALKLMVAGQFAGDREVKRFTSEAQAAATTEPAPEVIKDAKAS